MFQADMEDIFDAAFSPDGQRIVTALTKTTVRVYLRRIEDLLAVAACRVPRGLTAEEIQRFDAGTPSFDYKARQCSPAVGR